MRACHLNPGWLAIPDVEIVAVADIHVESARKVAEDFKIPNAYEDYRDLLRHHEIDAVDICTPNRVHTPAVLDSLAAGKHVLCEKPLAVTVAEVRRMIEASKKAKKKLMTAQHQRWSPAAMAIKQWIDAGSLGDVYHARVHAVRRNWLPNRPGFIDQKLSGGGPCMDIGVHALDLALHLMGFPKPVRVSGTSKVNFAKGHVIPGAWGEWDRKLFSVEDFAAGFVHFANGATMVIEASWLQHQTENEDMSNRLFGTKASVQWPTGEFSTFVNGAAIDGKIGHVGSSKPAHTAEMIAFYEAVTENKPSPVPPEESLKVIAILEAIMKSGKSGREVRLIDV